MFDYLKKHGFQAKAIVLFSFLAAFLPLSSYSLFLPWIIIGVIFVYRTSFVEDSLNYFSGERKELWIIICLALIGSGLYGIDIYGRFFYLPLNNAGEGSRIGIRMLSLLPDSISIRMLISKLFSLGLGACSVPVAIVIAGIFEGILQGRYCNRAPMGQNIFARRNGFAIQTSIFIAAVVCIVSFSYLFGYRISPDSCGYLREAQTLVDGHGMHNDFAAGDPDSWFTWWPVGYPALIAFCSLLFRVPVLLASVILSLVILGCIFLLYWKRFRDASWAFCLLFVTPFSLMIFSQTWSEQPFILGLVSFCFIFSDIMECRTLEVRKFVLLTLSASLVILSRYIGCFITGVLWMGVALQFLIYIKGKKKNNAKATIGLFLSAIVTSILAFGYMLLNVVKCGYATGLERFPAPESIFTLLKMLLYSTLAEFQNNLYISSSAIILPVLFLCAWEIAKRSRKMTYEKLISFAEENVLSLCFCCVGLIYYALIVYSRFTTYFDTLSFRLLQPATILVASGVLSYLIKTNAGRTICDTVVNHKKYTISVILFFICSIIDPVQLFRSVRAGTSYAKMEHGFLLKYQDISSGSCVLWAPDYIKFIRPDLYVSKPQYSPFFPYPQNLSEFEKSCKKYKAVYVDVETAKKSMNNNYHPSVQEHFKMFLKDDETGLKRWK